MARKCFVISPIGDPGSAIRVHADLVFHFIIEPALAPLEIAPVRSDQLNEPGMISEQMIREILGDDLCIAVLTGQNPNVFYELAIADSAQRPVVILIQEGEKLPFDVQDRRAVNYTLDAVSLRDGIFARRLREQVESIQQQNWSAVSPYSTLAFRVAPKYSIYVGPPEKTVGLNLNVADMEWNDDECFLVGPGGVREKIRLVPSRVGPKAQAEIEQSVLHRVIGQAITLELCDSKGIHWKVKSFFLTENHVNLTPVDGIEKIRSAYGDEEQ